MELAEPIERINKQLRDEFGIDTITGREMWRVVWANDQREIQYGTWRDYTSEGIFIREVTEHREVPKYPGPYKDRYILEHLVLISPIDERTLPVSKLSYEPVWTFETGDGVYLPPRYDAAKFIIDTVLAATGNGNLAKYVEDVDETKKKRADAIYEYFCADESNVTDALSVGEGIVVPSNYKKEN